jgi:hypothetical protein
MLGQSQPRSESQNSHNYGLQVCLQTRTIMVCKFISKLTPSRHQSASLSSLNHNVVNGGARRQTAHHQQSAAPRMSSEVNS